MTCTIVLADRVKKQMAWVVLRYYIDHATANNNNTYLLLVCTACRGPVCLCPAFCDLYTCVAPTLWCVRLFAHAHVEATVLAAFSMCMVVVVPAKWPLRTECVPDCDFITPNCLEFFLGGGGGARVFLTLRCFSSSLLVWLEECP